LSYFINFEITTFQDIVTLLKFWDCDFSGQYTDFQISAHFFFGTLHVHRFTICTFNAAFAFVVFVVFFLLNRFSKTRLF